MAAKNVGTLIKEARTKAGLTQEQLAKKAGGLAPADISRAERGEKSLTDEQLKAVAKALGITQKSLLEAPKGGAQAKPAAKPAASASAGMKLSADEKKLITLFRSANEETRAAVLELLDPPQQENGGILGGLLGNLLGGEGGSNANGNNNGGLLGALLGGGNNNSADNNSNAGGNLLGTLLGGVLGKREAPEDGGEEGK